MTGQSRKQTTVATMLPEQAAARGGNGERIQKLTLVVSFSTISSARDCPKKKKLSDILTEDDAAPTRVAPLQLLCTLRTKNENTGEALMVNIGATHSFMAYRVVGPLGLRVDNHLCLIKAVNSKSQLISGMAKGVRTTLDLWKGTLDFMVVPLDDFDIILGNNFFVEAQVVMMPHLCTLFIGDSKNPCFVHGWYMEGKSGSGNPELVSAMHLAKGWKKGETTYLATIFEVEEAKFAEIPKAVKPVLEEFRDMMSAELPKGIPPRRTVDHRIELLPGAFPAKAPYRMAPKELAELR